MIHRAKVVASLLCFLFVGDATAQDPVKAVSLTIIDSSGTTVTVDYSGLPGNQPQIYRNFVSFWQSSVVSWASTPVSRLTIPSNSEAGSVVLTGVSIGHIPSTVAYSVGPDVDDTCASALLTADGSPGEIDAVSLQIVSIGTTSLTLRYHTLSGYLPATAGNWIGLWRGRVSPYHAPPHLKSVNIPEDVTDDCVAINGVTLEAGEIYTVIYFMDKELTTAAVLLIFAVPSRESPPPSKDENASPSSAS